MTAATASVLLIDIDPVIHTLLAQAAEGEFAFFGAKTLELGLRVAARRPPAVAVIDTISVSRPAEQIVAALREPAPNARFVLLADRHLEPEERSRLTALGPVLAKPFEIARLTDLIKNVLKLQGMSDGIERLRSRTGQFSVPPPPSSKRRPISDVPLPSSRPPRRS